MSGRQPPIPSPPTSSPPTTSDKVSCSTSATSSSHPIPSSSSSSLSSDKKRKADGDTVSLASGERRSKRSRSGEASSSAPTARPLPPPEGESLSKASLSQNEVQIVKYLNELASHGIRSYATGFLIENCKLSLWYIDRMGVVKSTSFNFITEPHYLVYFIASVTLASMKQLGFHSLMNFPDRHAPEKTLATYEGVSLSLPLAQDIDGNVREGLKFSLAVADGGQIINSYGAVGRSTTIVPLRSSETTLQVCRDVTEKLVAKISWQSRWRLGEDESIRVVRTKLAASSSKRRFLDHIVDMKCSATYNMADMDLPRMAFGVTDLIFERVCRVLVLREYLPLVQITSTEDFKTVFLDTVRGMFTHLLYCLPTLR